MNSFKINRLKKGYTQIEVAKKMNVDKSTVSKWENGESVPRVDKLKFLSVLYDCSVDELLIKKSK